MKVAYHFLAKDPREAVKHGETILRNLNFKNRRKYALISYETYVGYLTLNDQRDMMVSEDVIFERFNFFNQLELYQ